MYINGILDSGDGKYILLTDHGSEGITVTWQSDSIQEIVEHLNESYGSKQMVVQLVDIKFEVSTV